MTRLATIIFQNIFTASHAEERGLIRNALIGLQTQHAVAVKTFGEHDPHLEELDAEREALLARARELGAVWA